MNWVPIHVSDVPSPTQLPASGMGKTAEDGLSVWAPDTYMGDPDGFLGSWLQLFFFAPTQVTRFLRHHLPSPRKSTNRKLEVGTMVELEPRPSGYLRAGFHKQWLHSVRNTCSSKQIFIRSKIKAFVFFLW